MANPAGIVLQASGGAGGVISSSIYGPVTGTLYIITQGQLTVSPLDAPFFIASGGWVQVGATFGTVPSTVVTAVPLVQSVLETASYNDLSIAELMGLILQELRVHTQIEWLRASTTDSVQMDDPDTIRSDLSLFNQ